MQYQKINDKIPSNERLHMPNSLNMTDTMAAVVAIPSCNAPKSIVGAEVLLGDESAWICLYLLPALT